METHELLLDHARRIRELYLEVVDGLDLEAAHARPAGVGNSIVWLLWHTARVQDDHVAALAGRSQAWDAWSARLDLPLARGDIGYGHTSAEVDAVRVHDLDLLLGYHAAVHDLTTSYLRDVDAAELDRVVDEQWDPPVTVGVRLVSVVGDALQHLGQAAYLRGLPLPS